MFKISDHIEFDAKGRAICPSCALVKGAGYRAKNLSLIPGSDGAYKCHRGCSTQEIREAIGVNPDDHQPDPPPKSRSVPPQSVTVSAEQVEENCKILLYSNGPAKKWLTDRGFRNAHIEHFKLGIAQAKVGDTTKPSGSTLLPAITIPIPSGDGEFYQKKRVAPWLQEEDHPDGYKPWSQYGIPAQVFFTHRPSNASKTYLCEGEWDAILLGWEMVGEDTETAVACFTCGAGNVPPANQLANLPGTVTIFYDLDEPGRLGAEKVARALGDRAKIAIVPHDGDDPPKGWDITDAFKAGYKLVDIRTAAAMAYRLPKPSAVVEPIKPDRPKSQKKQVFEALRERYGDRLRLNIMSKQVELDGRAIRPDYLYLELLDEDIECSKEFASDTFYYFAQRNQYHPVQDYLEKVYSQHQATGVLDSPATRYLGTSNPLYDIFVRKFAIAAVARVFTPGCKVDNALILQGNQGLGKSTFYKVLAGDWFDDSLSNATTDKDEKLKLHATWMMEWAELESIFSRKDVSSVKAFLSSATDKLRPPFARTTENYPRHSVIVGSTNTDDFLLDSTGSRRFWVVPIQKINIDALQEDRDRFWADAVARFKSGEQWWLTNDEQTQANEINRDYQRDDTWVDPIRNYCDELDQVTVKQILEHCLGIEIAKQDRASQVRVADALRQLGYKKHHTMKGKVWRKESQEGHRVIDGLQQGFQDDPSNDSCKSISHNDPSAGADPSNGQKPRVMGETPNSQDIEAPMTHLTQNSDQNQKSVENGSVAVSDRPLEVGDRCKYIGTDPVFLKTCRGGTLPLQVLEVSESQARVQADGWYIAYWIDRAYLRKV